MHQRGKTTSDHWLTDALVLLLLFFILKDPIFNFRKFNSRSYSIFFQFPISEEEIDSKIKFKKQKGRKEPDTF